MLLTPTVMATFRGYTQHFVPDGLDGSRLLFPFSGMEWENMADHWLGTWEDLVLPFKAPTTPIACSRTTSATSALTSS